LDRKCKNRFSRIFIKSGSIYVSSTHIVEYISPAPAKMLHFVITCY